MIDKIRIIVGNCTDPELECYEALMEEADGWQMRLDELNDEEGQDDE